MISRVSVRRLATLNPPIRKLLLLSLTLCFWREYKDGVREITRELWL